MKQIHKQRWNNFFRNDRALKERDTGKKTYKLLITRGGRVAVLVRMVRKVLSVKTIF